MKELEKKIEEAADLKYTRLSANPPYCEIKDKGAIRGFIQGAKSPEAKEYWFSIFEAEKSETEKRLGEFIKNNFDGKPSYSEEEVMELFKAVKVTQEFARQFGLPCDIVELFEQNKKK